MLVKGAIGVKWVPNINTGYLHEDTPALHDFINKNSISNIDR